MREVSVRMGKNDGAHREHDRKLLEIRSSQARIVLPDSNFWIARSIRSPVYLSRRFTHVPMIRAASD